MSACHDQLRQSKRQTNMKKFNSLNFSTISFATSQQKNTNLRSTSVTEHQRFMSQLDKIKSKPQGDSHQGRMHSNPKHIRNMSHSPFNTVQKERSIDQINQTQQSNNVGKGQLMTTVSKLTINSEEPSFEKSKPFLNNKFILQLLERRKSFIDRFGYIKQKNNIKAEENRFQFVGLDKTPNEEDAFLQTGYQSIKIENQIQHNKKIISRLKRRTAKSLKSKKVRNSYKDALQIVAQNKDSTDSPSILTSRKILYSIPARQESKDTQLDVFQITDGVIKENNKIFGRTHKSDSVRWCTDILSTQYQNSLNSKQQKSNEKDRKQQFKKEKLQSSKQFFRNLKRGSLTLTQKTNYGLPNILIKK